MLLVENFCFNWIHTHSVNEKYSKKGLENRLSNNYIIAAYI